MERRGTHSGLNGRDDGHENELVCAARSVLWCFAEAQVSRPLVVVVGSCNTDLTVFCKRLPGPGETVIGGEFIQAGGGKGANQAVAAARAGAEVVFVARIGPDEFSRQRASELRREGIKAEFLVTDRDAPGGVALIMVDSDGENLISVAPGANARMRPDDVLAARDVIERADVLLSQLEIPLDVVETAAQIAHGASVRVVLDPAPVPEAGIPGRLLSEVDVLTPNRTEAAQLVGADEECGAEALAAELVRRGPRAVALTLGAGGACVCCSGACYRVPACPARVVDSVGAGDCFAGALSVAIGEGKAMREAVEFALAAAAISVERKGAQPSLPYRKQIQRRLGN